MNSESSEDESSDFDQPTLAQQVFKYFLLKLFFMHFEIVLTDNCYAMVTQTVIS